MIDENGFFKRRKDELRRQKKAVFSIEINVVSLAVKKKN